MRIDLNAGSAVPNNQLEKSPAAHASPAAAEPDDARISRSDTSVSALAASALQAPETRTQKVEALRSQIKAGTYQVSPGQIASSVLEHIRAH